MRLLFRSLPVLFPLLLGGCSTIAYYAQAVHGHFDLISRARPVDRLLSDPSQSAWLRAKLQLSQAARDFSIHELKLPDNGSYRDYADLQRSFAVWNVVATPALSIQPKQWCLLVVGCISYRGYFSEADAQDFGKALSAEGYDVVVAGAQAYSTLGWFDDPLLNTVMKLPDAELAGLIFHELVHQRLYVKDDSSFNEAFAVTVAIEGVRRWLIRHGAPGEWAAYKETQARRTSLNTLLLKTRERLETLYASPLSDAKKLKQKREIFVQLRQAYLDWKQRWNGYDKYDRWFNQDLNNAHLALVATYNALVPAFDALLAREGGDLKRFYAAAEALAQMPYEQRHQALAALGDKSLSAKNTEGKN